MDSQTDAHIHMHGFTAHGFEIAKDEALTAQAAYAVTLGTYDRSPNQSVEDPRLHTHI